VLGAGVAIAAVDVSHQMLAGHADIGATANIYAHLDTTDLGAALRGLGVED